MSAFATLAAIASDPLPAQTAREVLEARLGRPLGSLADMDRSTRDALSRLAKQLARDA